jgi:hypothetical protein
VLFGPDILILFAIKLVNVYMNIIVVIRIIIEVFTLTRYLVGSPATLQHFQQTHMIHNSYVLIFSYYKLFYSFNIYFKIEYFHLFCHMKVQL